MKNKVFLGGTVATPDWRNILIPELKINFFNPIVENWTEEFIAVENDEKENKCDVHLYLITSAMTGVYSIAEAVQSSHIKEKITIFQVVPKGFTESQLKSLRATGKLIESNEGLFIESDGIAKVAKVLNKIEASNWSYSLLGLAL